jgi:hypothetical protein
VSLFKVCHEYICRLSIDLYVSLFCNDIENSDVVVNTISSLHIIWGIGRTKIKLK